MGKRGPQPTPRPILQARGSWRAKLHDGEAHLPVERPGCPPLLKGEAKKEWSRQAAMLVKMGVLTKADRAMLAVWCDLWQEYSGLLYRLPEMEAELAAAELAAGDDSEEGKKAARLVQQLDRRIARLTRDKRRVVQQLFQASDRFGFSPAARVRVKVLEQEAVQDERPEGKARFFRGGA